ncbi:MAG: GWxTD domain-containing protein [Flavobacteriales bacterium]
MSRIPAHIAVASALLLAGCGSYAPAVVSDNFAYLYGKGAAAMRLQARVYHATDDRSTIYFKLHTADLLYKSGGDGGPFRAQVLITYEAYPSLDSRQLLDSASTLVKDQSGTATEDKDLIGSMDMKRNDRRSFVVRLVARDLNRDVESVVMLHVGTGTLGSRQDFLPMDQRGIPLFDDEVAPGTVVKVRCEQHAGHTLYGGHYEAVTKLPAPVFTEISPPTPSQQADSTFTIQVPEDGNFTLTTGRTGFYHLRPDTTSMAGYSLFVMKDCFPDIRTSLDMVPPLRYITSLQEWDRITAATDKRKEVERFWLDASGDRERAREAIAAYYGRVESANRHFTSFVEGWKTDRGLVHIIFGTPSTIRKGEGGETWIYGEETNLMSLTFTFVKRDDPYSDNDLVLRRDPQLKSAWYRNVESWRNGRIMQY